MAVGQRLVGVHGRGRAGSRAYRKKVTYAGLRILINKLNETVSWLG